MPVKSGIKTTEFWASLAAAVGSGIAGLSGALPATWSAVIASVSGAFYALSRGLAKMNAAGVSSFDPADLLQEIERLLKASKPAAK